MTRRCSHCSNNGHNSRTCPTRTGPSAVGNGAGSAKAEGGGLRIFGVRLTEGGGSMIMKKSASMGCLSHYSSMTAQTSSHNQFDSPSSDPMEGDNDNDADGYASDDPNHVSCSLNRRGERKKGIPWTEEEHRRFLVGLQKLGKGDWRGIARNYVISRTPTQVASHAQKYFIRQTNASRRKRRSSLFDMVPDMVPAMEESTLERESQSTNSLTSLNNTLERESMPSETVTEQLPMELQENASFAASRPPLAPAFYPSYIPMPYPYWSPSVSMPMNEETVCKTHVVLRPTPVLPKNSSHADELVRMSNLSIKEASSNRLEPSELSSKLLSPSSSRQSAFHANPAVARSDLDQSNGSNAIHAV